jgi:hypothetical protein
MTRGAWFEVDEKTLDAHHHNEEDITASVKNGKTTDGLGASDSKNNDHSYEVVVPKLSTVLNINEVMTCLKYQTDNEHLHFISDQYQALCSEKMQLPVLTNCIM